MEQEKIHDIFDKAFKTAIGLSSISIINFINGLFDKDLSIDSEIRYFSTENIKDDYSKIMADCIIGIGDEVFLIEVQINNDNTMAFRVFEYSYFHAIKNSKFDGDKNEIVLKFPNPKVILLEHKGELPDYKLRIQLEHQEDLMFKVSAISLLDLSVEELFNKKMVILIPLYLLKLRKEIQKKPNKKNANELKDLIENGIIKAISKAQRENIITIEDWKKLIRMTDKIYNQIYGGVTMLNKMKVREALDEQFDLFVDDEISHANIELRAERRRANLAEERAKQESERAKQAEIKLKEEYRWKANTAKELLKLGKSPEEVKFLVKLTDKQINKLVKEIETENHKN